MTIHSGDCHNILITLPRETFDAMITDPPYGLLEKKQTNDRKSKTLKSMSSWDRISYNCNIYRLDENHRNCKCIKRMWMYS